MTDAYLTIDDIPSENLSDILAYLKEKKIVPVMFATGALKEKHYENLLAAIRQGIVVGNHSFSHRHFSEMSIEECIADIEKMEELLNQAYQDADVPRKVKVFRFPYIDRGGKNLDRLQVYLKEQGFVKLKDENLSSEAYYQQKWDQGLDVAFSYDCAEYMLQTSHQIAGQFHVPDKELCIDDVIRKMQMPDAETGVKLIGEQERHLILLHAHDETEKLVPGYYKILIDFMLAHGVNFMQPEFISL